MTKEIILTQKQERLHKLEENGKNIKSRGVIKKLKRQIANLTN